MVTMYKPMLLGAMLAILPSLGYAEPPPCPPIHQNTKTGLAVALLVESQTTFSGRQVFPIYFVMYNVTGHYIQYWKMNDLIQHLSVTDADKNMVSIHADQVIIGNPRIVAVPPGCSLLDPVMLDAGSLSPGNYSIQAVFEFRAEGQARGQGILLSSKPVPLSMP
jgi:hypothetical protein